MEHQSYWLWYPGDFERYHALKQNFSRVERGCGWPAFWKSEGFRHRVVFRRQYTLTEDTRFTVRAVTGAVGYVLLDGQKYPFGREISCAAGTHSVAVHIGNIGSMPAICVQGDVIRSDPGWEVGDFPRRRRWIRRTVISSVRRMTPFPRSRPPISAFSSWKRSAAWAFRTG